MKPIIDDSKKEGMSIQDSANLFICGIKDFPIKEENQDIIKEDELDVEKEVTDNTKWSPENQSLREVIWQSLTTAFNNTNTMDHQTQCETDIWLIGQPSETLKESVLPSKREAMALFMHYKLSEQTVHEALTSTAIDVMQIWQKAHIPTIFKKHVIKKLNAIYDEWIILKKNKENKKKQSQSSLMKQTNWNKSLDELFDIAHANAFSLIEIEEDREFLHLQRQIGQKGRMTGVDTNILHSEAIAHEKEMKRKQEITNFDSAVLLSSSSPSVESEVGSCSSTDEYISIVDSNKPSTSSGIIKKKKEIFDNTLLPSLDVPENFFIKEERKEEEDLIKEEPYIDDLDVEIKVTGDQMDTTLTWNANQSVSFNNFRPNISKAELLVNKGHQNLDTSDDKPHNIGDDPTMAGNLSSIPMEKIVEVLEFEDGELFYDDDELKASDIQSIVALPPTDGEVTDDVDSDDENNRSLLTSPKFMREAEIVYRSSNETNIGSTLVTSKTKKARHWKSTETFPESETKLGEEKKRNIFENLSIVDSWEAVFTDEIITLLVNMSNKYAMQHNHSLNITQEEMKVYIAILLLTGYLSPNNIRMFWEIKQDVHNELVASAMRRNRFVEIHQFLHTSDNFQLLENDKYAKLADYFSLLNKSFLHNLEKVSSFEISINETLVPYYGKHGCKQQIYGKPVKFGYKLWSACTPSGYLIQFIPYQGSKATQFPEQQSYGLGASVVLQLLSTLPKGRPYSLYFDNFFTSLPLLDKLSEMEHFGTGTIRENQTEKCPLATPKEMKEKRRGAMSMKTTSTLAIVRWNDGNIVTMASNASGIHPVSNVTRITSVNKKRVKITVPCPRVVSLYNKFIVGVNRFNENVESQRISFRGKKWWYPLFAFGIDAACQNAWKIYQATSDDKITYCEFRRNIVQAYLGRYKTASKKSTACGSPVSSRVHPSVRTDNSLDEHVKEQCNHAHCAHCHKRTRIKCKKCKVPLHISCWYVFHNK